MTPGSSLPWGCFNDISDGSPRAGAGKYRVSSWSRLVWILKKDSRLQMREDAHLQLMRHSVKEGDTREPGEESPVHPGLNRKT